PGPLRHHKVFGRAQPRKHLADPDRIGARPRPAEFAVDERLGAPDKGHPRSLGELTRCLYHPRQVIGDKLLAGEVRAGPHALIIPPYPLIYETLCAMKVCNAHTPGEQGVCKPMLRNAREECAFGRPDIPGGYCGEWQPARLRSGLPG